MSIGEWIAIVFGGGGLLTAIFTWFTTRGAANANLADIYKKIASIDANSMLEEKERNDKLERRVEKLEQPRTFRFSIDAVVDGDGIHVTKMEAREIKTIPVRVR